MSVDKLREWFKKFRRGEYCISMSNLLAKCVYRILRFSHRYPNDLQRYSFALSEKKEISRVAAIYNSIKWTKDQNTEFNQYWKSHLGRTIPPYWHKLYECYSGNYNIRYFPGILCTSNLQFRLNPFQQCDPFSNPFLNKALYEVFFGGTSEGLQKGAKTPRTLGVLFNGLYYDDQRYPVSFQTLLDKVTSKSDKVVIKPLRDAGGNGICFLDLNKSENGRRELRNVLLNYKEYIIQAELKQSSTVSRLHEHSINTFRVVTYICDDKLYHSPVAMRVGQGGKRVDNCAEGGLGVGVNENGDLMKYGYYHDHKHELRVEKIEEHPDSHIKFEGYHIPNFNGIIETAYRVHGRLSGYGIISWDIMLDEKDEPVVVEVNLRWPNIDFIQEVCGLPCFGDNTEKMINMLNS